MKGMKTLDIITICETWFDLYLVLKKKENNLNETSSKKPLRNSVLE